MEPKQIDLYEFLVESELQHYYNSIKNELKIANASHLKYATDEDLKQIGLSRPEIRRLRKFYEKYYPHGYLSKIKRLLQTPKRDEGPVPNQITSSEPIKTASSPSKIPSNKHIIPADSICVNKQLGTGEFGIVQQGVWTNGAERIQVAIKCLCRERMQSNPMEFLKEAAIMHAIEHENIVRLYGVVLDTDSLMLVTELAHLRSLLECLKDSGLRVSFLTVPTLCEFAMQICNGMMYLENKRLIHRDLAARNILVFSKNKVKISDFGLSRALGVGKDYYKTNFNVNLKLPIAWCAPECINYLRFTNSSDVWAYGVCLWEMFSYGFQPWAALTGLQILEAIDEPNYQRLEQPECCPREYYTLMLKCWQHDPIKRPKFSDIYSILPDMKPEQLKTIASNCESKKDHLLYRQGEIITVLDKATNSAYWKGVLNSGKTGLFNPANTVAYLEGLPSSTNRDSFCRTSERSSKRKLRTEMISMPQNDLKHTGHVGLDGAYFGDVAFLASQNYNHLPRQIVTPYKPSEDIEQTPLLLPPTPTSPDSLQTASGYFPEGIPTSSTNPTFINSNENTPKHHQTNQFGSTFDFPQPQTTIFNSSNPFATNNTDSSNNSLHNNNYGLESNAFTNINLEDDTLVTSSGVKNLKWCDPDEDQHEYHEISDDEITTDKMFDLGPSLLDEINSMFGSISAAAVAAAATTNHETVPKSPDFDNTNIQNEIQELTSKLNRKNSHDSNGNKSKKKLQSCGTVKPISVKDEKILNHAIEIANEISARSMTDLVSDHTPMTQSPKRKFSFRFPNLTHHHHHGNPEKNSSSNSHNSGLHFNGNTNTLKDRKNFSEELRNIPDLQSSITEGCREAYNSLIERKSITPPTPPTGLCSVKFPQEQEFKLASAKTLPRKFLNHTTNSNNNHNHNMTKQLIMDIRTNNSDLSVPTQQAPRPTTLPNRNIINKFKHHNKDFILESSPLRILRDKNYPIIKTKQKYSINLNDDENLNPINHNNNNNNDCESPSYMTNISSYTFPDDKLFDNTLLSSASSSSLSNPIPLPPRDRNKIMQTNVKRHVRKHPLIIPGNGLKRTLNKVTDISNDKTATTKLQQYLKNNTDLDTNLDNCDKLSNTLYHLKNTDYHYNNNNDESTTTSLLRTYENLDKLNMIKLNDDSDSASLHFESILEDDFNKVNLISSPDIIDKFLCPFTINKDNYNKHINQLNFDTTTKISGLYVNEDELRNLDYEKKKLHHNIVVDDDDDDDDDDNQQQQQQDNKEHEKFQQSNKLFMKKSQNNHEKLNELAENVLFNKIRDSVNMSMNDKKTIISTIPRTITTSTTPTSTTMSMSIKNNNNNNNNLNKQNNIEQKINDDHKHDNNNYDETDNFMEMKLKDSNSVSCEDLLEFSNKTPTSSERGVDSDEVRIMQKVLGKDVVSPQRCLETLEFIGWDVHKAIKLIKLQNILNTIKLTFEETVEALKKYDWDLQLTAMKLKGFK